MIINLSGRVVPGADCSLVHLVVDSKKPCNVRVLDVVWALKGMPGFRPETAIIIRPDDPGFVCFFVSEWCKTFGIRGQIALSLPESDEPLSANNWGMLTSFSGLFGTI